MIASRDVSWLCELAHEVGQGIVRTREKSPQLEVQEKSDKTPVTVADQQASAHLVAALQARWPHIPVLSEEASYPDYPQRARWERYWLLDPLDGTRGFIQGGDEFTVNIALIIEGVPCLGVIGAPVWEKIWVGQRGDGAYCRTRDGRDTPVSASLIDWQALRILTGRFHGRSTLMGFLAQLPGHRLQKQNSSLKFATIAEGGADVYPRFGAIYEWDIAAGQAILQASGGQVIDLQGEDLQYNTKASMLSPPFLALGRVDDPAPLQQLLRQLGEAE